MSTLETNSIGKYNGNNVSLSDPLRLKNYTTSQKNALTAVAGDLIYDTDLGKAQIHNGSSWGDLGESDRGIDVDFLVVAGGASGYHSYGGGGGAGGFRASWNNETSGGGASSETAHILAGSQSYTVTVGGGGSGNGGTGSNSTFAGIESTRGGAADSNAGNDGGSGGGGRWASNAGGAGTTGQGYAGGSGGGTAGLANGGGGGGAGGVGQNGPDGASGADGGIGATTTIITTTQASSHSVGEVDGSDLYFAGGGAGGMYRADPPNVNNKGIGGKGGGGNGGVNSAAGNQLSPESGTANTGGGGGGQGNAGSSAGNGGSGVVILKWTTADATLGGTRTGLTDTGVQTDGDYSYIVFTAGTGVITFS